MGSSGSAAALSAAGSGAVALADMLTQLPANIATIVQAFLPH